MSVHLDAADLDHNEEWQIVGARWWRVPQRLHFRVDREDQWLLCGEQSLERLPHHSVFSRNWLYDDLLPGYLCTERHLYASGCHSYSLLPDSQRNLSHFPDGTTSRIPVVLPRHNLADSALLRHKRLLLQWTCGLHNDLLFRVPGHALVQDGWHHNLLRRRCLGLSHIPANALHYRFHDWLCTCSPVSPLWREAKLLSWCKTARVASLEALLPQLRPLSQVWLGQRGYPPSNRAVRSRLLEKALGPSKRTIAT